MAQRIGLRSPEPDVVVDLGDQKFKLRPWTRSVEDQLAVCADDIDAVEDNDRKGLVAAMAAQLDVILTHADNKRTAPSKILVDAYEDDDEHVNTASVATLIADLTEAARPTRRS